MYELIILLIILIFIVDQNVIFSQKFYSLLSKNDYRLPILYKKKKITVLSRIHPYMFDPTILSVVSSIEMQFFGVDIRRKQIPNIVNCIFESFWKDSFLKYPILGGGFGIIFVICSIFPQPIEHDSTRFFCNVRQNQTSRVVRVIV